VTSPAVPVAVRDARVGRLATVRAGGSGRPHLVPVVFAFADDRTVVCAVDDKPKRTTALQRLRNIRENPNVCLLVDHYSEDWTTLWWVRLDCTAEVVRDEPRRSTLLGPLVHKYAQYREHPPTGPVIAMTITSSTAWRAALPDQVQ
jgi:PPOX class probable F420-dependent enzyme